MPIGYKLYVKESPVITARDGRKISEYKKLLSFPNLRLIHNSVNPFEILKKCSLVITIVGNAIRLFTFMVSRRRTEGVRHGWPRS